MSENAYILEIGGVDYVELLAYAAMRERAEKAERELAKQERLTLEVMEDRDKAERERDEYREQNKELFLKLHEIQVHYALWTGEDFKYSKALEVGDE